MDTVLGKTEPAVSHPIAAIRTLRGLLAPCGRRWQWRALLWALSVLLLGCRSNFYGQAVRGQCQILLHRRPVLTLLTSPQTPPRLAAQLRLALQLRAFAEKELNLPACGNFLSYVDVHRPHVVWNVYAAPEFGLTAKTWWYPLVGRLEYRGYFVEAEAGRYAARLSKQGWDTYVGAVDAYSTLGWFREPLLNTFINYPEPDLAGILFHELAHQKVFAKGDSDFDEAFATVVEEEGVRRWLKTAANPQALAQFEHSLQLAEEYRQLLSGAEASLRQLYDSDLGRQAAQRRAPAQALAELRERKQRLLRQMEAGLIELRRHWGPGQRHIRASTSLNNAKLASEDTYYRLAPAFRRLLAQHHHNLPAFYAAAYRLALLPKPARHRQLVGLK